MRRYVILFLVLIGYTITIPAQTNNTFNDWVTSLVVDSSGIMYAGTYSNGDGIFLSTNGGDHWQQTKMRYGVTSMTLTKSGTIVTFAYGYSFGRYLFRLTHSGSELDSVVLDFTPTSIAASQDGSLYATTFGQGIYKSTDDGTHWFQFGAMTSPTTFSSAITVTKEGVILVSTNFGVFLSSDSGANWRKGRFGFHDSLSVKHIIPSNDGKIYAGAFESMDINANEIYVSSDTGKNWTLISRLKFSLDAMAIDSIGNIYAGNSDGVYRIKANGDTSYLGPGGIVANGWGVRSLLVFKRDTIFAGAWGGVYRTTDAGTSWEFLNDGLISDTLTGNFTNPLPFGVYISSGVVDKNGHFIVGTDSAGVFRSIDRGKTWLQTNLTVPFITSVIFDSLGNLWAASLNNGVFRSTDNGASWTSTDDGGSMTRDRKFYTLAAFTAKVPRGGSDSTQMITEHIVFGGNDWGVYHYFLDDIGSWSPTGTINISVSAITPLSTDVVASTLGGDVYINPGGWTEWKYKGSIGVRVAAIVGNSSGMLFVVGPNGAFRSIDKGVNWIQKNSGILDTNLVSAAVDKAGNIFVGSYQSGDIYKSTDQGDNWIRFATLAYPVRCLFIGFDGGNIYAAAADRFFRSVTIPTSVFQTPNVPPKDFSLSQNYPNPFNPSTVISYSLPANGPVTLKVYDVLGREVAVLVSGQMSAGGHSVQWNAENYPSGVYFYRLQAGSFVETKKLVFLK
jgi:photosystem II stability/assembly factor-like uncharacterized protein